MVGAVESGGFVRAMQRAIDAAPIDATSYATAMQQVKALPRSARAVRATPDSLDLRTQFQHDLDAAVDAVALVQGDTAHAQGFAEAVEGARRVLVGGDVVRDLGSSSVEVAQAGRELLIGRLTDSRLISAPWKDLSVDELTALDELVKRRILGAHYDYSKPEASKELAQAIASGKRPSALGRFQERWKLELTGAVESAPVADAAARAIVAEPWDVIGLPALRQLRELALTTPLSVLGWYEHNEHVGVSRAIGAVIDRQAPRRNLEPLIERLRTRYGLQEHGPDVLRVRAELTELLQRDPVTLDRAAWVRVDEYARFLRLPDAASIDRSATGTTGVVLSSERSATAPSTVVEAASGAPLDLVRLARVRAGWLPFVDGTLQDAGRTLSRARELLDRSPDSLAPSDWVELTSVLKGVDALQAPTIDLAQRAHVRPARWSEQQLAEMTHDTHARVGFSDWVKELDLPPRDEIALRDEFRALVTRDVHELEPADWGRLALLVESDRFLGKLDLPDGATAESLADGLRDAYHPWGLSEPVADAMAHFRKSAGLGYATPRVVDGVAVRPERSITRGEVDAFLAGSAYPQTVFHGFTRATDQTAVVTDGYDVSRNQVGWYGRGGYFASSPGGFGQFNSEFAVRLEHPLIGTRDEIDHITQGYRGVEERPGATTNPDEITANVRAHGYDGIIMLGGGSKVKSDWIVAFDSAAIKTVVKDDPAVPELRRT
jgi:hypothetical protein